jgi:hypothetical protein
MGAKQGIFKRSAPKGFTMTGVAETPPSYLSPEEREALLREGGRDLVYLAESQETGHAGDEETAWAWL